MPRALPGPCGRHRVIRIAHVFRNTVPDRLVPCYRIRHDVAKLFNQISPVKAQLRTRKIKVDLISFPISR